MPLRSAGAIENDRLRGKINSGIIGRAKVLLTGLAPQKVVESNNSDPTRDTYQRKVFYDGINFFIIYYDQKSGSYANITYVASLNGKSWTSAVVLYTLGTTVTLYVGGNIDIGYPNRGAMDGDGNVIDLAIFYTTNIDTCTWHPYVISGQTLVSKTASAQGGQTSPQGGTIVNSLNGEREYMIYHRDSTYQLVRTLREPTNVYDGSVALSYGGNVSGGNQLLPYKTSSPYKMFALVKGGDDKLYYNIVNEPTATFAGSFTEIATLGTGFSDFCGCSEVQNVGDPERVHLVYIKSTGELCYNKFENDTLGIEKVLVASGASYPVIASGSNGKLYVFYVKDGKIWVIHYNGNRWLNPVELFVADHTYNNPSYLSCNQNVQSGKICLVWTEGTSSPYEVWFCYLED